MKKQKIFLDTTIISYLYKPDKPEKEAETWLLWKHLMAGEFDIFLSDVVLNEVENCPEPKRQKIKDMLKKIDYLVVSINDPIEDIADEIIRLDILKKKNWNDCLHIGCAIHTNCDLLLSWNFADLVNPKTSRGILTLGLLHNFSMIEIISPFSLNLKEIR